MNMSFLSVVGPENNGFKFYFFSLFVSYRITTTVSADVANQFLDILGYVPETRRASGGMLADSSMLHIKECLGYLLTVNRMTLSEAQDIVREVSC